MDQSNILQDSVLGSKWFNPEYLFNQGVNYSGQAFDFLFKNRHDISSVFFSLLFFFSIFFLSIIFYSIIRLFEIRKKEHAHLHHEIHEYALHHAELDKKKSEGEAVSRNPRWIQTLHYLYSQHASDWKLAVIEADSMLESLLDQLGFAGNSLGEKLKNATAERFKSLPTAWEVHTIRNRIAHEGGNFELSQHEAKRLIAMYEQIFRQYGFI